jgi:hypothetical protein
MNKRHFPVTAQQTHGPRQSTGQPLRTAYGGHLKSDGADSLVDTSIRRRPYDDAEVTDFQVQV